jgi:hypothetical protein
MRSNTRILVSFSLVASLCGCGTVDTMQEHLLASSSKVEPSREAQEEPKVLQTHVGGQIFKIDRTRPLPNAFGGADIFGRKIYAGFTELRFLGVTDDGKIVLRVTEVETHSTETTMSRSGMTTVQGHVNQYGFFSGTVTPPPQGSTELLSPHTTQFLIDPSKDKELTVAGVIVKFLEFTPAALKYSLVKAEK